MIHGDGVQVRYDVIITGRAAELMKDANTPALHEAASNELMKFRDQLRTMKRGEFDEYYALYRDEVKLISRRPKEE